jgi:preprotein translocase subunit SecE
MARVSPFKFLQEVRAEGQKVTWPTRRETAITTMMVFIMTAVAAVFFLISDKIMWYVVTTIIGWADAESRAGRGYSDIAILSFVAGLIIFGYLAFQVRKKAR